MRVRVLNYRKRTIREINVNAESMADLHETIHRAAWRVCAPITIAADVAGGSVEIWNGTRSDLLVRYSPADAPETHEPLAIRRRGNIDAL